MNVRILNCKGCGVEFSTKHAAQVFCTKACCQSYRRRRSKEHNRTCKMCGKPINIWETSFCSRECVAEHWARSRPKCERIGCDRHVRRGYRFCSRMCWRESASGPRKCVTCGKVYKQTNKNQGRRCSACYNARKAKIRRSSSELTFRIGAINGRGGFGSTLVADKGEVLGGIH